MSYGHTEDLRYTGPKGGRVTSKRQADRDPDSDRRDREGDNDDG